MVRNLVTVGIFVGIFGAAMAIGAIASRAKSDVASAPPIHRNMDEGGKYKEAPKMTIDPTKTYTATIDTSRGEIVMDLYPKDAPIAVNNFVFLARDKFYDGLTFHRVEDWVVQGGDPSGNGTGGPGYTIKDEAANNPHSFTTGALGMARTAAPDTGGSQFFIVKKDSTFLDGKYTCFGQVTKGMDVVQNLKIGDKIKKITITETGGDQTTKPTTKP